MKGGVVQSRNLDLALEISAIQVKYPSSVDRQPRLVVNDIDLQVRQQQIVGIVGESGSGKTTLAMAIAGFLPIAAGQLRVAGQNIRPNRAGRKGGPGMDIQIIFQHPHESLDPRQSIESGFRELRRVHPKETGWITDSELLERVGLGSEILKSFPRQVSGGQAQRIAIARALMVRPRLLIADEPTSSLDVSVQAQILNLITDIRESNGLAVLFISHNLSIVKRVCDYVYIMHEGRIVESGITQRVLDSPTEPYTQRLILALPGSQWRAHREASL